MRYKLSEFEYDDVKYVFLNHTRRQSGWWNSWFGINPYADSWQRAKICLCMQISYKNAYLCHEIIFRYQILLELYQMIEKRYYHKLRSDVAPSSLMLYFYTNILEESQAIIHLCNMLHEIEDKYRYNSPIKKKHDSAFQDSFDIKDEKNRTLSPDETYERYQRLMKKEALKRERERKKQRKMYLKFGITTKSQENSIYRTKKSRFPLHYGWSLEDWPPKPKGYRPQK
ncbi:unnamed protein product [Leptosia nina]|uniref:Uncharacterized protein n=1 Tax=Leptosia nina TaxID=320188 RepID=A0AAV1JY51_9NEOP